MKKLILFALMGALFSLSCSRNDEVKPVANGRYLTIKASMPNDNNMTRAFAGKKDAGYTDYSPLIFRWRDGDEIKVLLEQDGVREFQTTQATNVTNEGKNAEFKIDLQSFNTSKAINVICAFGNGVSIDDSSGNITINTPSDKVADLGKRMAIYSKETLAAGATDLSPVFKHLYAYVCLRVQNVGNKHRDFPVGTTGLKLGSSGTNWLYSGATTVDLNGATPSPSGSTSNSLVFFTQPNSNIAVGEIAEFWGAFIPVDVATPDMQVSTDGSSSTTFGGTLSRKSGGGKLEAGNVYYISSTLNGNTLTFGGKALLDKSKMPSMIRFTTTKNVGETVKLKIYAKPADRAGVWIDLNNNGVKDSGEDVTTFSGNYGLNVSYTLGSREVTIYGKVTELNCEANKLSSLDVSNNVALENLYCSLNGLTSLGLGNNVELKNISCDNNQITFLNLSRLANLEIFYCYNNNLKSLDVSKNTKLSIFLCYGNSNLQQIFINPNHKTSDWSKGYNAQFVTVK